MMVSSATGFLHRLFRRSDGRTGGLGVQAPGRFVSRRKLFGLAVGAVVAPVVPLPKPSPGRLYTVVGSAGPTIDFAAINRINGEIERLPFKVGYFRLPGDSIRNRTRGPA